MLQLHLGKERKKEIAKEDKYAVALVLTQCVQTVFCCIRFDVLAMQKHLDNVIFHCTAQWLDFFIK